MSPSPCAAPGRGQPRRLELPGACDARDGGPRIVHREQVCDRPEKRSSSRDI